jgi:MSHA pilin protein MshC
MPRTDRNRAAPEGSAGYSLVELIVVLLVIGVMAATIAPRFWTQSTFDQRGYADELAGALRFAQKAAVISGCHARLTLAAGSYVASQQAALGNACNPADATWSTTVLGPDGAAISNSAPSGTTATPTGVYEFDGQGRLVASPGTTITVGARSISIDANTGFLQVH